MIPLVLDATPPSCHLCSPWAKIYVRDTAALETSSVGIMPPHGACEFVGAAIFFECSPSEVRVEIMQNDESDRALRGAAARDGWVQSR